MQKKQLVKKLRKGRGIYYGPSDQVISAGLDEFFQNRKPFGQIIRTPGHESRSNVEEDD